MSQNKWVMQSPDETYGNRESPEVLDEVKVNCNLVFIFHITQNFIMERFAAFERSKLHQILKTASISP